MDMLEKGTEVMTTLGKVRNAEGQMVVYFATRMEMAVLNTFQKEGGAQGDELQWRKEFASGIYHVWEGIPKRDRRLQSDSGG